MNQLPAYLQGKIRHNLNAIATAGMGSLLPPHISIAGNGFTLIDSQGQKMPIGPMMEAVVVDMLEYMGKKYYENDWTPGSDEPPTCWSTNGVAPSRDSMKPQAATCGQCQWNVRGSDVSRISNKPIKACRDEKMLAIMLPQYPQMLFQLIVPPGSFKNWSAFMAPFSKASGVDVSDCLVRFGFQPQVNGVLTFELSGYIPEALVAPFNAALQSKATDAIVGRNDVPIAMLAAPQQASVGQQMLETARAVPPVTIGIAQPAQQFGQPAGGGQPAAPFGAGQAGQTVPAQNAAAFGQQQPNAVPTAATTSPSEPARRRRRTQAEIAADNAAKAGQAGQMPPGQAAPVQPQTPFPANSQPSPGQAAGFGQPGSGVAFQGGPAPAAAGFGQAAPQANPAPAGGNASFGIQNGAEPDPQLAAMLASLGGTL